MKWKICKLNYHNPILQILIHFCAHYLTYPANPLIPQFRFFDNPFFYLIFSLPTWLPHSISLWKRFFEFSESFLFSSCTVLRILYVFDMYKWNGANEDTKEETGRNKAKKLFHSNCISGGRFCDSEKNDNNKHTEPQKKSRSYFWLHDFAASAKLNAIHWTYFLFVLFLFLSLPLDILQVRANAQNIYQNMSNKIYNHNTPILIAYARNLGNVSAVCESANRFRTKRTFNRFKNAHALAFTLAAHGYLTIFTLFHILNAMHSYQNFICPSEENNAFSPRIQSIVSLTLIQIDISHLLSSNEFDPKKNFEHENLPQPEYQPFNAIIYKWPLAVSFFSAGFECVPIPK